MGHRERFGLTVNPKLRVVVLTGAGISIESGVPIFRGKGSMWEKPEARRLASKAGPPWNTRETWEYYEWRRKLVNQCKPNAAHYTLVDMEEYFENFCLITQNVDGLHVKAGSKNIQELHGNMWKGRCTRCGRVVDLPETPLESLPPRCICGNPLRPQPKSASFDTQHESIYQKESHRRPSAALERTPCSYSRALNKVSTLSNQR